MPLAASGAGPNARDAEHALAGALGSAQRPLHYLAIPPNLFSTGTWGPVEADRLIDRSDGWHKPQPAAHRGSRVHPAKGERGRAAGLDAWQTLATLARTGISIDDLTARLLDDGVREFSAAFDTLMGSIEERRDGVLKSELR